MAKILIIGGGVSGLSAGIYARKNGHEAIVCERHKSAGGNLTGWQRGEYHVDNCIHWLTGTNPATATYRSWLDLGALGNVEIYQPDFLFTCDVNGERLSAYRDLDKFEREALRIAPRDKKEILGLTGAIRSVREWMGIAPEYEHGLEKAKQLLQLPKLLRYYRLSTGDLAKKFTHPLLRKFTLCMMGKDFTALALIVTLATFCGNNGGIPQGGSSAMAERMVKRFCDLGGQLKTGCCVTKLLTRGHKVTAAVLNDGSTVQADYFLCACDPKPIFEQALNTKLPKPLQALYDDPKMQRFSSLHAAYACDVCDLNFRGDHIFELPLPYKKSLHSHFLILREFSHEPTYAPTGKTVLQAMVFCNETTAGEYIELRKDRTAYRAKKRELSELFQTAIAEKFPQLRGKLLPLDVWTPATYERYTGAETGSYMSFLLPKNKLPISLKSTVSGLKNFLLATQWQQPPGGLPTAAALGKRAAETVAEKERKRLFLSIPPTKRKKHALP